MSSVPHSSPQLSSNMPVPAQMEMEAGMGLDIDLDFDLDLVEPVAPSTVRCPPARPAGSGADNTSPTDPLSRTMPMPMLRTASNLKRRVLVVSADPDERMYLRARLALAKLTSMVEASTTTQAQAELDKYAYVLVLINLDDAVIDGIALVREFHLQHPGVPCVGTLSLAGMAPWPTTGAGSRQDTVRRAVEAGFKMVLDKPMVPKLLADLFNSIQKK